MKRDLTRFASDRALLKRSLANTQRFYRLYDPGWYLYRQVVSEENVSHKFSNKFIELIYVTLTAWNMNSRGAWLAEFEAFRDSLKRHRRAFISLGGCGLIIWILMNYKRFCRERLRSCIMIWC